MQDNFGDLFQPKLLTMSNWMQISNYIDAKIRKLVLIQKDKCQDTSKFSNDFYIWNIECNGHHQNESYSKLINENICILFWKGNDPCIQRMKMWCRSISPHQPASQPATSSVCIQAEERRSPHLKFEFNIIKCLSCWAGKSCLCAGCR